MTNSNHSRKSSAIKTVFLIKICLFFISGQACNTPKQDSPTNTPESLGEHISQLLVNRADIKPNILFDINRRISDEDIPKFDNGPSRLLLRMLLGQQAILPALWNNLLVQADSLKLTADSKYVKTYFIPTNYSSKQYLLIPVIASGSAFYTFCFKILEEGDERCIMSFGSQIKKYKTLTELEQQYLDVETLIHEINNNNPPNDITYNYNQAYTLPEIQDVYIPSINAFIHNLTYSINHLEKNIPPTPYSQTDTEYMIIQEVWEEVISSLKKEENFIATPYMINLSNTPISGLNLYNALITYSVDTDNNLYNLQFLALLKDGKWQLANLSKLSPPPTIDFQF